MICKMISAIKTMYYRLFYWFFRFNKKKASGAEETDKEASVLAVILLSAVMFLFVFSLLFVISLIIKLPKPSSLFIYSVGIVIVVFNSFFFFSHKRYLIIKKKFENEDRRTRIVRSLICFLFVFISMFAMGILGVLFGNPFLE